MAPTRHRNRKGVRLGKTSKKRGGVFKWLSRAFGKSGDSVMVTFTGSGDTYTVTIPQNVQGNRKTIDLKVGDYFTRKGWTGEYYGKVDDWSMKSGVVTGMTYSKVRPVYNSRDISLATSSLQLKKTNWTASRCQSDVQFPKEHPYMIEFDVGYKTVPEKNILEATNTDLNFWQNIEPLAKDGQEKSPANPKKPDKSLYVVTVRKFDSDMKGTGAKEQANATKYVAFYETVTGSKTMKVDFEDAKDTTVAAIDEAIKTNT